MNRENYPRLKRLVKIANLPEDRENFPEEYDETSISRGVWDYYDESESDIEPVNYRIVEGDDQTDIKTILGVKNTTPAINTDIVKKEDRFFSEYDFNVIEKTGINTDKLWNGEVSDVSYIDGEIRVGRTDYFSTAPFTRILSMEVARAKKENSNIHEGTPLRNRFLKNSNQFKEPPRPIAATGGGVIVANKGNDQWVIILGRRSKKTDINRGLLSIFPNGKVEYEDADEDFNETVKREFNEEIFGEDPKGDIYFDKHIISTKVTSGWNLKTGSLTVGHVLIIKSRTSYDVLKEVSQHNDEIEEFIEIPVDNIDKIKKNVCLDEMSGTAIPVVYETLKKMDKSDKYPSLPYNIERR